MSKPAKRLYAMRLYGLRKILFRRKQFYLEKPPRTGICSLCHRKIGDHYIDAKGKDVTIERTHIHHDEYHDDDVLKDTRELCMSCHMKESWRLGQFSAIAKAISMSWKRKREERGRHCFGCGSDKTTVNKDYGSERWTLNRGTDLVLCRNCTYSVLGV